MVIQYTSSHPLLTDQSYSQCEQLLDVETVGGGVFRPDVADPEMSQACTTSLWELALFRVHIIAVCGQVKMEESKSPCIWTEK